MPTLKFKKVSETSVPTTPNVKRPSISYGDDGKFRIACDADNDSEIWFYEQTGAGWREQLIVESVRNPIYPRQSPTSRSYVPQVKTWRLPNGQLVSAVSAREGIKEYGPESNYGPGLVIIPGGQTAGPYLNKAFNKGPARIEVMLDGNLFLMAKDGDSRIYRIQGTDAIQVGATKLQVGASGEKIDLAINKGMLYGCKGGYSAEDSSCYCTAWGQKLWMAWKAYTWIGRDEMYPGIGVKANGTVYLAVSNGQLYFNRISAAGKVWRSTSNLAVAGAGSFMDRHMPQLVPLRGRMSATWTAGSTIMMADLDGAASGKAKATPICEGNLAASVGYPGGVALAVARGGDLKLVKVEVTKS